MTINRILNRKLGLAVAAAMLTAVAPASAAPQWLTPQTISPSGQDTTGQQVAFDQGGDAVAVWQGSGPPHSTILASARPAGGVFGAPQTLSDPGADSTYPDVTSDAQGDVVAVWLHHEGAIERVQAAYRPAGGTFGAPQTLSETGANAAGPRVAMDGPGDAVAVWSISAGGKSEIQAASAAPGGSFGAPVDLTGLTTNASIPQVALDSHGDAIAVWDGWDGTNIRIQEASRPAGGSFGASQFLSPTGYNADTPQVAFDAAGDALAVWRFDGPPASTVQAAYSPAGGAFGSAETVSAASSQPAQAPQVAFDGQRDGVVAWQQSDGAELRIDASVRTSGSGGMFTAPSTLDPGGQEAYEPRIAGDGLSATIVSWKTFNGIANSAQASVRSAGGSFAPAVTVSPAGPQEDVPAVGVDAQGNGILLWSRSQGANYRLEAAGYDGAGPLLRGLSLPAQGVLGQPLEFFQAPLDVWSPVLSEGFSFGDGATGSGVNVTHAYTAPGSYRVTASATDVLGNVTTVTQTLTIGQLGGGGTPAVGTTRCTLTAPRTQKLLGKGRITANAICGVPIDGAFSARLTVRVPRPPRRGHIRADRARGSTLRSYTLRGVHVQLVAGRQSEVQLRLSAAARRVVLAALRNHRQVGLYLTLVDASGSGPRVHAQAHVAHIAVRSPMPK